MSIVFLRAVSFLTLFDFLYFSFVCVFVRAVRITFQLADNWKASLLCEGAPRVVVGVNFALRVVAFILFVLASLQQ